MKITFLESDLIKLLSSYYYDREGRTVSIKLDKKVSKDGKASITYNAHEDITINNVSASLDYELDFLEIKNVITIILSELGYEVLDIREDKKVDRVTTGYYTSFTTLNPVFNGIVVSINPKKKEKKMN